jgi:hypothetical protein
MSMNDIPPRSARSDMFVELERRRISLQRSDIDIPLPGSGKHFENQFYKHVAPIGARNALPKKKAAFPDDLS